MHLPDMTFYQLGSAPADGPFSGLISPWNAVRRLSIAPPGDSFNQYDTKNF
jgi:hypothetical protein